MLDQLPIMMSARTEIICDNCLRRSALPAPPRPAPPCPALPCPALPCPALPCIYGNSSGNAVMQAAHASAVSLYARFTRKQLVFTN